MSENEGKTLVEVKAEVPVKPAEHQDDILDGLYREVLSREIAHREGRPEGRNVVVELPDDGEHDFISYGQKPLVEEFDRRLDKDQVKHRGIDVGRYPAGDAQKLAKVQAMAQRQLSGVAKYRKALKKHWFPALPGFVRRTWSRYWSRLRALRSPREPETEPETVVTTEVPPK